MNACMCITESLYCTAEIGTTLYITTTLIQKKFKKKTWDKKIDL